jgi:hypothetical protein
VTLSLTNQGFDYVAYYNGAYENDDSLPALEATGANAIEASVEYGINPKTSTVYEDSSYTDSLNALGATIREAVGLGLSVMVRPLIDFVDPSDLSGTPYSLDEWRTYFNPGAAGSSTANAFFASYQTMILQEAQVAVANGATSLCIGTELDQITGPAYKSYWDSIISALRTDDPSLKLTYAADWDNDLSPWQWGGTGLPAGTGNLATQVSFASELDSIGVDVYAPISDASNPTLAQLVAGWTQTPTDATSLAVTGGQSLIAYFEGVAAAVGKPLVFTELGYENASDAASQPAGSSTNVVDSSLQAELYQAFFEAWQQGGNSSLTGVYFWNWDPNAAEVGPGEGANFSPQGLPAEGVATDWFGPGPAISFNAPTRGANNLVTLTGTALDSAGAQSVELFNGATDLGAATLNATTGAWTYSAALPSGVYRFSALATDQDGKQSSALASFVVALGNAVAPTISETKTGQTTISEAPVTPFSGVTIDDPNSGATDTLTIALTGGGALSGAGLNATGAGVYALAPGSAAAVTEALRALVFTPRAGAPHTTSTTSFTLTDVSSDGGSVSDGVTSVIDNDPAVAPTIIGTLADQTTAAEASITPFSRVTIGDLNNGATDDLTIIIGGAGGTLSGAGLSGGANGVYVLSGSAASVTGALEGLAFTPTAGAPDTTSITTFTLNDASSAGVNASDNATSVIDHNPAVAPTIGGTLANQQTISEASIAPFSQVTIGDLNNDAMDDLTITIGGAGGTLSGAGLSGGANGVYALSGSAASVTSALEGLAFTPAAVAPNTASITTFALNDASSAGTSASDGNTSVADNDPDVAPTAAFNTGVAFSTRTQATLTGTVSDPSDVASLEICSAGEALGAATVHRNGTWTFAATLPKGDHNALSGEVTDEAGGVSSTQAPFELRTGIRGQPYTSQETDFNEFGQGIADTYTQANGVVYLQDIVEPKPNGGSIVDWTGGSYFDSLDYYFQTIDLSPDNTFLQQTFYNDDGTHTVLGSANSLHLVALGDDTMKGGGVRETFVFKAHPGEETITDFKVGGPRHDAISLPSGEFASIAQIFHGFMQQSGDNTVITLGAHSSITLDNIAAGALTHSDFVLRA